MNRAHATVCQTLVDLLLFLSDEKRLEPIAEHEAELERELAVHRLKAIPVEEKDELLNTIAIMHDLAIDDGSAARAAVLASLHHEIQQPSPFDAARNRADPS